jgi:hypothetical protein
MPEPCFLTTDPVGELGRAESNINDKEWWTRSQLIALYVDPKNLGRPHI